MRQVGNASPSSPTLRASSVNLDGQPLQAIQMINTRDALLPALKVLEGAGVLHRNQIIDATAGLLKISDEERQAKLPSGRAFRYRHRISWAITFLTKAKFVARVRRG